MSTVSFLDLHGDRVAYREAGQGPAVLLIHGMGGSSLTWHELMPHLAQRFRVIAPDLLGHGLSDKPRGDYSLGAFAVWLRDLLDRLGIDRVSVVGHSFGGGVAMQFAHQHPDYCERLVLISSGGLGPDLGRPLRLLSAPGAELLLPVVARPSIVALGERIRQKLVARGLVSAEVVEGWKAYSSLGDTDTRQAFLRTLRSVVDYRGQSVSALSRLPFTAGLPTLLIWGAHDRLIPPTHGEAAHAALPGSRLVVLPDVGHFPHVEAPLAVADTLDTFIATTTPWQRRSHVASVSGEPPRC